MNNNLIPNYKTLTRIPLFRRAVLQSFPFIEEDFDALTDYELLCKVVEYLNKVIIQQNLVGENTDELLRVYLELKEYVDNYFDNLDVQEEINNKLDNMVEQGTLQEIIADYLNSKAIFGFDNVASMKNSTNLIDGSYARTLGYHSINDGGGSLYKIREITNSDVVDEMTIIAIGEDDLIAELIYFDLINPEQFGAYGDNTHDDTTSLQTAINKAIAKNKKLIAEKTYKITSTITILGDFLNFDLFNSTINYTGDNTAILITRVRDSNIHLGCINANSGNCIELKSTNNQDYCQYLNLYFRLLYANDKCIIFNRTNRGWLNEIRIFDGMLNGGNYGIYADADGNANINNITIQNVGIEGVTTGFYLANGVESWNIIDCRYHESFTTLIETVGIVKQINFIGTGMFYINKCNFSSLTNYFHIISPIPETGGEILDTEAIIISGFAYLPNLTQIKNIGADSFDMTTDTNKNNLYNTNITYFYASSNTTELILSPIYGNKKGLNEFILYAGWDAGHSFTIKKDSTIIYTGNDTSWGRYIFKWTGSDWIYERTTYANSPTS